MKKWKKSQKLVMEKSSEETILWFKKKFDKFYDYKKLKSGQNF